MAKVLLIDDHPGILEVTSEILTEKLKCNVDKVESAGEGLELCKNNKYDIICTDYLMPKMNGAEFINELRKKSGPNQQTKVFVLTGNPEDAAKNIQNLTDINIIKKVDGINILVEMVASYLKIV